MKVSPEVQRIRDAYDYYRTLGIRFSIADLFSEERERLLNYCRIFSPHKKSKELIKIAIKFCQKNGIWDDKTTASHLSCDPFLYPDAEEIRLLVMMKHLSLDYRLNDLMGRDKFDTLEPAIRDQYSEMINRMSNLDVNLIAVNGARQLELVNLELLAEIKKMSPAAWFSGFLQLFCSHIKNTHRETNFSSTGTIPSVQDYIELRRHTSGMLFMMMRIEFSDGNFLNWELLEKLGIATKLRYTHTVVADFGGLSNDFFSMEKEIIKEAADGNLLAVIAKNFPWLNFKQILNTGASYLIKLISEYFTALDELEQMKKLFKSLDPKELESFTRHLKALEIVFKACWIWQTNTDRYVTTDSIFTETKQNDNHQMTA